MFLSVLYAFLALFSAFFCVSRLVTSTSLSLTVKNSGQMSRLECVYEAGVL